ncbi:glycoside hydrolase family 108 protein [Sinorhizobium meliloti]|uniref:glycoside hydrolase family 108 protein n=1 Tax=Rhizobium meliloti TaxID=382 RepID=UPI000FE0AA75|nr:glycosyl hydrolase 108 family protein [Sinorhizobium meliloti]RVG70919.1 hypothetical protein CN222_01925 [Sinorhizobium meliloti]
MKSTYAKAMKQIRQFEGGYINHPRDPGGATNFGVTQAVYDEYRSTLKLTKRSVKSITESEVDDIYLTRYANKVRYDDLPAGIDFATLDGAVNSGVSRGAKWLQSALGISADGVIGAQTVAAATAADALKVIKSIYAKRTGFLRGLSTYSTFGKGWLSRCATGEAFSAKLQMEHRGISPKSLPLALQAEADHASTKSKNASAGVAGSATGAASSSASTDWSNLADIESIILIGAAFGLVVLAIYLIHRSRVQKERAAAYAAVAAGVSA